MEPQQFIAKWRSVTFGEKQASQEMFLDICALVDHPTPVAFGDRDAFTFEKSVPGGYADAYYEEHFGWEFKGRDADLDDGLNQLLRYQVHLKTPPLLIVSSFRTIRIRTNFPGMETVLHEIPVAELDQREHLDQLRRAFHAPADFRPSRGVEKVTRETADIFSKIVIDTELRHDDPGKLARYLNQIVFCLYAEGAGLLRNQLFTQTVTHHYRNPSRFDQAIRNLFSQMSGGGLFGYFNVDWFDGNLFEAADTLELSREALQRIAEATTKNWRSIEPTIFGTLFERALDASKRSQLGAHYTSPEDIELVVEPVVMEPLRREWETARQEVDNLIAEENQDGARIRLEEFQQRLFEVTVLDPACGSGNFLYVALRSLLDLEKEVIDFAATRGWHDLTPRVKPDQMHGLEINPYAAELARTALWIGYIQWHQANGFPYSQQPILTPLDTIRQTDAILADGDTANPQETEWPAAEFIIGNPPFLGHFPFREQLGDEYVNAVYSLYGSRIPNSSDLCCYWFEKARAQIESGKSRRAGCWRRRPSASSPTARCWPASRKPATSLPLSPTRIGCWTALMYTSPLFALTTALPEIRTLDGEPVFGINADLTTGTDLTQARRLAENQGLAFQGIGKVGDFDISEDIAVEMMSQPNPHGRPNTEVLKRWINGIDITRRPRNVWVIDFGIDMPMAEAALYEAPFEYVKEKVMPERIKNKMQWRAENWWLHGYPATTMRRALAPLKRYMGTPKVAKHRFFVWLTDDMLASNLVIAIASDDDYVRRLTSKIPRTWALAIGYTIGRSGLHTPPPRASRPSRSRNPMTTSATPSPRPPSG